MIYPTRVVPSARVFTYNDTFYGNACSIARQQGEFAYDDRPRAIQRPRKLTGRLLVCDVVHALRTRACPQNMLDPFFVVGASGEAHLSTCACSWSLGAGLAAVVHTTVAANTGTKRPPRPSLFVKGSFVLPVYRTSREL